MSNDTKSWLAEGDEITTDRAHPELPGLRCWMLATADAQGLYAPFGFAPLKAPVRWMEKHDPDVYAKG